MILKDENSVPGNSRTFLFFFYLGTDLISLNLRITRLKKKKVLRSKHYRVRIEFLYVKKCFEYSSLDVTEQPNGKD